MCDLCGRSGGLHVRPNSRGTRVLARRINFVSPGVLFSGRSQAYCCMFLVYVLLWLFSLCDMIFRRDNAKMLAVVSSNR